MRRKITYNPGRDYYAILKIDTHATTHDIRRAFRQHVRAVHPDLNPDRAAWATEQIQLVNEAYSVLSNPSTRREYDKLRWPYIQHAPPRHKSDPHAAPPAYDPNRPWWEQVAERAPRGYPFSAGTPAQDTPTAAHQPGWLVIANWLKRHRLGALERTLITMVGIGRSPYAGWVTLLSVVLALNVALIIYGVMRPGALNPLEDWITGAEAITEQASPTPPPTPTLALLAQSCIDPLAAITIPLSGDVVGDEFSVYGTVDTADLWSYEIAVGYLGMRRRATEPDAWETVRSAPTNQSIAEPAITEGLLTETPITLSDQPAGYYAIRLRIALQNGDILEPCDVIVLH